MAREVLITCDAGGETPTRAYAITDVETGEIWDLDLCDKHDRPLRLLAAKGRLRASSTDGRPSGNRSLDGRIRGLPSTKEEP